MAKLRGNAIVGQSGGPTVVINQSLVGVIQAAAEVPEIDNLFGARHGIEGIIKEDFINLLDEPKDNLELVANTPSAALGSTRRKPNQESCQQMFDVMQENNVRYFFYIGGNDSAEGAYIINQMAQAAKYELRCFHVPKTIDNDLKVTDHCPGFGSAAKFVASVFMGDNLDNRSLPGIKLNIVMGRHAGFLTAASALAKQQEDDAPHLIYLPERPISITQMAAEIGEVYQKLGRCVVAVSEGVIDAEDAEGRTFAEVILKDLEVGEYGNKQLSGSGALGDWLASQIKDYLKEKLQMKSIRLRADTLGYMQRSFPGVVSEVDAAEARMVGRKAVEFATSGDLDGSVAMIRTSNDPYTIDYQRTDLVNVAKYTTVMADEFINASGNHVTPAFLDYCRPLVGSLPQVGYLKGMKK